MTQTRDLEVRVRIPVQVQIFLLKFMKYINVMPGIFEIENSWDKLDVKPPDNKNFSYQGEFK